MQLENTISELNITTKIPRDGNYCFGRITKTVKRRGGLSVNTSTGFKKIKNNLEKCEYVGVQHISNVKGGSCQ